MSAVPGLSAVDLFGQRPVQRRPASARSLEEARYRRDPHGERDLVDGQCAGRPMRRLRGLRAFARRLAIMAQLQTSHRSRNLSWHVLRVEFQGKKGGEE